MQDREIVETVEVSLPAPVELTPEQLEEVGGGMGPAGTWSSSNGDGPAGTW